MYIAECTLRIAMVQPTILDLFALPRCCEPFFCTCDYKIYSSTHLSQYSCADITTSVGWAPLLNDNFPTCKYVLPFSYSF